jgi:hypothetical protein
MAPVWICRVTSTGGLPTPERLVPFDIAIAQIAASNRAWVDLFENAK